MGTVARPIYSLDDVPGVSAASPASGDVLKWNGTAWVAAAYNASVTFSIASFSDGQAAAQLVGLGVWKAIGAISFTASYAVYPAASAYITLTGYWSQLPLTTPFEAVVSAEALDYPIAGGVYTFALNATGDPAGIDVATTSVTFHNYIYYGILAKADTYLESDVESLTAGASPELSGSAGRTINLTAAAGEYLIYALPVRLGTVAFTVNGFTGGFEAPETVSVENSAGYVEDYYVYRSTNSGLGAVTLVVA